VRDAISQSTSVNWTRFFRVTFCDQSYFFKRPLPRLFVCGFDILAVVSNINASHAFPPP
jgi:hypothetical protein